MKMDKLNEEITEVINKKKCSYHSLLEILKLKK